MTSLTAMIGERWRPIRGARMRSPSSTGSTEIG